MKSKEKETRPYRLGVGAVLFNTEGKVFTALRIDTDEAAWQLPQGGIDDGEDPKAAVRRELAEETGIVHIEIIDEVPGWLSYDLPAELSVKVWKGRYRGQKQKWYALRFLGGDIDLNAHAKPEFSDWKWIELTELPEMIVSFKRPLYQDIVAAFRHIPASLKGTPGGREGKKG